MHFSLPSGALPPPTQFRSTGDRFHSAKRAESCNGKGFSVRSGLLALLFCLLAGRGMAAVLPPVKASWNANPEADIAGYEVSYGTKSGIYTTKLDAGRKTSIQVSGLKADVKYYFVVVAYSTSGQRSVPSDEIIYQKSMPPAVNRAPDGWFSAPDSGVTLVAGEGVAFSGDGSDPDGDALSYHWNFGDGSGIPDSSVRNPGFMRFMSPGSYQVTFTVKDSKGLADPAPAVRTVTVLNSWSVMPRTGWKLKYVNSQEANGYAATQAFDGNPATFWHTRWTNGKLPPPHQIQVDLGAVTKVKGFKYLPRQDGIGVGDIGKYKFYVSMDGRNWGEPVTSGQFTAGQTEKQVFCTPKNGKFIRLVSFSDASGQTDCNVAELNILQGPPVNRAPAAKALSLATRKNKQVLVSLKGSDADGDAFAYQILTRPKHGKLVGTAPQFVYIPDDGFTGKDTLTFRTHDGLAASRAATVTIRVNKPAASATKAGLLATTARNSATAAPVTGSVIIDGAEYLVLTAGKPAVPDGVKRSVQVSSNLVDWFSGRKHTTVIEDNERFLKVRDNTPLTPGARRYIRLKTNRH